MVYFGTISMFTHPPALCPQMAGLKLKLEDAEQLNREHRVGTSSTPLLGSPSWLALLAWVC